MPGMNKEPNGNDRQKQEKQDKALQDIKELQKQVREYRDVVRSKLILARYMKKYSDDKNDGK